MKQIAGILFFAKALTAYCCLGALCAQTPHFNVHEMGEAYKEVKVVLATQTTDGFFWFGTNKGLFQYDGFVFQQFLAPDSLTNNEVSALFEDKDHQLWIGYKDGAIFYLDKSQNLQPWIREEGWPKAPIMGFERDDQGLFWIATYGEGIYFFYKNQLHNINTDDGLLGDDIYTLAKCHTGKIWIGTDRGLTVCTIAGGEKVLQHITKKDGLPDDIVRKILADDKGNLWIGTYDQGICYLNVEDLTFSNHIANWDYGAVKTLELFEDRELWIGTENNGIYRYFLNDQSINSIDDPDQLIGTRIFDFHKDQEGNIWVVNNSHSVYSAQRQFEWLETPLENIQTLLVNHKNQLLIGTQKGLFLMDKEEIWNPRVQAITSTV